MSKSPLINLLYIFVVTLVLGTIGYACLHANSNDIWFLQDIGRGGNILATFQKSADPSIVTTTFVERFGKYPPRGVKLGYQQLRIVSCGNFYLMFAAKGDLAALRELASANGCSYAGAADSTLEKGGVAFSGVLPSKWRSFKLYRGISPNGNDLRVYIDEEKERAYMTEQRLSIIKSAQN
ncbi:hypothetical protein DB346_14585 [Verrucomicrobia bacterium LW23]|nr:hypothetical protein DB346_14585 [Verrucomicrobia bacterium LW23]